MLVKETMNDKHPSIYEDELATKARALIRDLSLRILPVTDADKKLLGKISRSDVMIISSSISPIRAKGIMTTAKHVARVDDDVVLTIKTMLESDAWHAPVIASNHDRTYLGVVGLENFIEPLIKTNPERLLQDASEVMTKNVITCSPEDEVDSIWRLMQKKRFAGLPVVRNSKLVGIVTHKDLLETGAIMPTFESEKGRFRASSKISSIMQTDVTSAQPTTKMIRVAKAMISRDIGRVPVKQEDEMLMGIIDREDVARILAK